MLRNIRSLAAMTILKADDLEKVFFGSCAVYEAYQ